MMEKMRENDAMHKKSIEKYSLFLTFLAHITMNNNDLVIKEYACTL